MLKVINNPSDLTKRLLKSPERKFTATGMLM